MEGFDLLSDEQHEILRQFQEVTNTRDDNMAVATLQSVRWDLMRAIEAHICIDDDDNDNHDDDNDNHDDDNDNDNDDNHVHNNIVVMDVGGGAPISTSDKQIHDILLNDRGAADNRILKRLLAGSSAEQTCIESSRGYGTDVTESSSSSTARTHRSSRILSNKLSDYDLRSSNRLVQDSHTDTPLSTTGLRLAADAVSSDSTDSDEDVFHDAAAFEQLTEKDSFRDDQVPLVPSDFTNIDEALHNFVAVFEARYGGNHPPFYSGSLQDALREALEAPGRPVAERRPLAVYLHNDNAIACNIFAKNILCSGLVSSLLKGQFVTWPWDVTQVENKLKLLEWIDMLNVREVKHTLEKFPDERFPLLVVIIKEKSAISPVSVAWGSDGAQQVVNKLMEGLDEYQRIKNADAAEERERIEREQIRQEQAREYERSLAQDRARQEKLERERNEQKAEKERLAQEERDRTKRLQELAASLPEEPSSTEKDVAVVRVRFPDGKMLLRRFRMNEPLRNITLFVESKGYSLSTHRIWTSDVPKKNMESYDLSLSLADVKWPVREQITVDEK